jgi:hypothetical protein
MKIVLIAVASFLNAFSFGQISKGDSNIYDLPIPNNIDTCFLLLDKTLTFEEIYLVKTLQEDSIYFNSNFKYGADFFHAWKLYEGSILTDYFNKLGLRGSHAIYETILISYHRYLNNDSIKLSDLIKKYQDIQAADNKIYLAKLDKDSLNGIYIPKDLKDCFLQLDKILTSEDREQIKNLKDRNETINFHHSLGMWIRNNWGLWGGSRLQKYLLEKNLNHPDEMSSLILEFYFDWLNGNNKEWEMWMK